MAEALIRQRVEDLVKAIRAKDIDGITSPYAANLVSFDIAPPLRYVGADNNGVWLVVHDHVSVPADLEHGQAVLSLTP